MSNYEIRELQSAIFYIAKEVKRICERNNIHYSLLGGTLLGAIRHKGFIPWDDDMDIMMLREDYEKFLLVCKTDLSDDFELINWNIDNRFGDGFTKIMIKGTQALENGKQKTSFKKGIFLDVFPFDNIPNSKFARKLQRIKTFYPIKMIQIKNNYKIECNSLVKKIVYFLAKVILYFLPIKLLISICNKNMIKYDKMKTKSVTCTCGFYGYFKEIQDKNLFDNYTNVIFENETFESIKNYDQFLKLVFGDYMKLPPIEQIRTHSLISLDYGNKDFLKKILK